MFHQCLLVQSTLIILLAQGSFCIKGKEFIFAFPKHNSVESLPYIKITRIEDVTVNVTVTTISSTSNVTNITQLSDTNGGELLLKLSTEVLLTTSDVTSKSICVVSDSDVIILAVSILQTATLNSAGTFQVFPVSDLSSRYVAVTTCKIYECHG
ncbi:uncharacterized protein LOC131940904 [Physella acuta]|uniref:uncharacterized protein LOC131940904 n=1 Tax=Physella acuta TaxID=109671 RepID=UPI0027DBC392|nr:uncharacterized protein LOC131940904 [Physella acuta]